MIGSTNSTREGYMRFLHVPTSTRIFVGFLLHSLVYTRSTASLVLSPNPPLTRLKVLFDSTNQFHRDIKYHPEQPPRIESCVAALQKHFTNASPNESSLHLDLIDFAHEPVFSESFNGALHVPFLEGELEYARSILVKAHSEEYVANFQNRCRISRQRRIDEGKTALGFIGYLDDDTYLTTETYDVCLRATAAWIRCVDLVTQKNEMNGNERNSAFALTRPPGHHATKSLSNGFCIFNFAAAAAIHAVESGIAKHVSLLDWDVHYGQGVSNILQHFPQTRYVSVHQTPAFPYQGEDSNISGEFDNILTVPLPPNSSWEDGYKEVFQEQVLPFIHSRVGDEVNNVSWEADLVIVCAGYDALLSDELASFSLTAADYGKMTRQIRERIELSPSAKGSKNPCRLLFGLEGGYQLKENVQGGNLADAVVETVKALS